MTESIDVIVIEIKMDSGLQGEQFTMIVLGYEIPIPRPPQADAQYPPVPRPTYHKHALHVFIPREKWTGQFTMWQGFHLTKSATRGTSSTCPKCGERLPRSRDMAQTRQLWCRKCGEWFDRDLVAVLNISRRGWLRFDHSKGLPSEAMRQERGLVPSILRVDGSKLTQEELTEPNSRGRRRSR